MTTLNLALTITLAAILGFALGNVYGQQKMKMLFNDLLNRLTEKMKLVAESAKKEDT